MKILFVSDFPIQGSGYFHIAVNTCIELTKQGHEVRALGINYKGEEHHFPFQINPIAQAGFVGQIRAFAHNMYKEKLFEHMIVALDITHQLQIVLAGEQLGFPVSGIFPLEAPPLTNAWAMGLMQLKHRFVISQFAEDEFTRLGIEAHHLPIPVDTAFWRASTFEERAMLKKAMGIEVDRKVVLQVADNQERKNLSLAADIIAKTPDVVYMIVTRRDSPAGWILDDLYTVKGIRDRVMIFDRGMEVKRLWSLYAIADAFLMSSKAEGLGMPVLEAMSCGIPVVAPDHTSFREHLSKGRGYLYDVKFEYLDVFGNEMRYFGDATSGSIALTCALQEHDAFAEGAARAYVEKRSWDRVGDILCKYLTS